MFRVDQFIVDQDKHDQYFLEYFHSVEPQNRLRLPHIAKTHFFMKIEYNDLFYSSILFISRNSSFVISPLANLNFNALIGSSPLDDDAVGAVLK